MNCLFWQQVYDLMTDLTSCSQRVQVSFLFIAKAVTIHAISHRMWCVYWDTIGLLCTNNVHVQIMFIVFELSHLPASSKAPFTWEQFSKGPLLDCSIVFSKCTSSERITMDLLSKFSCDILLYFTMLKLSKGPQLNYCRVNSTNGLIYLHGLLMEVPPYSFMV